MARGDIGSEGVRSLQRGIALLQAMNRDPGATVTVLAQETGVARSTAYRLLDTFVDLGLVRLEKRGGYRLTRGVLSLSHGFPDDDWLEPAWEEMVVLGQNIGWPLALFTAEAGRLVIRRTTHDRSALSIDYGMTGKHAAMTSTAAGFAYLAFCTKEERAFILSLAAQLTSGVGNSGDRSAELDDKLRLTREQGFATCVGALNPRTASLSVPVVVGSRVLCCLSAIWIRSAQTMDDAISHLEIPMKAAAAEIAQLSLTALGSAVEMSVSKK